MKCFVHNEIDAIGICKRCNKGLCSECAVDLGKGLACKGPCENDVQKLIEAETISMGVYQKIDQRNFGISILFCALGAMFLFMGIYSEGYFTKILGVPFLIYGIFSFAKGKLSSPHKK